MSPAPPVSTPADRVHLLSPIIECLLYLPSVQAIQYKLGPKKLTRLGYSNQTETKNSLLSKIGLFTLQNNCVLK